MECYKIITLVDITRSGATRAETDKIKIGQQANFNSLLQAIGLRANVVWSTDPKMKTGRLPNPLDGKANHWIWEFDVEREDVFLKGSDSVGLLVDDLNGVPVVDRLNNTAEINPSVFISKGPKSNIWVYKIN